MKLLARSVLFIAVMALAMNGVGYAATITGSIPLTGINSAQDGANLGVSTVITTTDTITSGAGLGDLSVVPLGTSYGPATLDLTDLGSFMISSAGFGSFAADGLGSFIVQQSASFLDVYLLGTYSGLAGFEDSEASLRISLNQSGQSISGAVTLNAPAVAPPNEIPEPVTMAVTGLGLIGLGALRLLRKA